MTGYMSYSTGVRGDSKFLQSVFTPQNVTPLAHDSFEQSIFTSGADFGMPGPLQTKDTMIGLGAAYHRKDGTNVKGTFDPFYTPPDVLAKMSRDQHRTQMFGLYKDPTLATSYPLPLGQRAVRGRN